MKKEIKRVLMTGASGFLGTHLSPFLEKNGLEVHHLVRPESPPSKHIPMSRVYPCNLSQLKEVQKIVKTISPSFVIHLAAKAIPNRSLEDFDLQMENTITPAINLALSCSDQMELALFFGSCEEYGNGTPPFTEEHRPLCISPYGWGKIAAFEAVSLVAKQKHFPWCWIRPFLTFGPGQKEYLLIPSVIMACLKNKTLPLTPGLQTRDVLYVDDLCLMIQKILERPGPACNQVFNLCSGRPRTVRSIAESIQAQIGKGKLEFGTYPYRINEAMSFFGSPLKFQKAYGLTPLKDFEDALISTIQFYSSHQK